MTAICPELALDSLVHARDSRDAAGMFRTASPWDSEVNVRLDRTLDPSVYSGFFDVVVENVTRRMLMSPSQTFPISCRDNRARDIGFLRYGIRFLAPGGIGPSS
jgi:hypothetical protein